MSKAYTRRIQFGCLRFTRQSGIFPSGIFTASPEMNSQPQNPLRSNVLPISGFLLVLGATIGFEAQAASIEDYSYQGPRNVLELFTSQGCASCQPADKLLSSMAHRPGLLVLSLSIDYWDYNGWKDTLANPAFTARQRAYAMARGDRQIYTPQTVIDGVVPIVGSDAEKIEEVLHQRAATTNSHWVPIRLSDSGSRVHVSIGAGTAEPASVFLLSVDPVSTVQIRRGENAGRAATYTNVVKRIQKIGDWDGSEREIDIPKPADAQNGYVILLQRGDLTRPGEILGAAKTPGL